MKTKRIYLLIITCFIFYEVHSEKTFINNCLNRNHELNSSNELLSTQLILFSKTGINAGNYNYKNRVSNNIMHRSINEGTPMVSFSNEKTLIDTCPGNLTFCDPHDVTKGYTLSGGTPSGGEFYCWEVPSSIPDQLVFSPTTAGKGVHKMTYIYPNISAVDRDSCHFYITVTDTIVPGLIIGPQEICNGIMVGNYSISHLPDSTIQEYIWSITGGWNFSDSTLTSNVNIPFDTSFHGGVLHGKIRNECGIGGESTLQITVKPTIIPIIKNLLDSISQSDNTCKNQHISYAVNADFESYLWKITPAENGKIIGDSTSRMVSVLWNTNSGNTNLTAKVVNNGCPGSGARTVNIGEGVAPDPATIWLFGCNMLVCSDSTATCYQWLQDGQPLDGIVTPPGRYIETRTPTLTSGSKYEVITCSGAPPECQCCNYSLPYYHNLKSGCDETSATMTVIPNPARDKISLLFSPSPIHSGHLLLFNQYGVLVKDDHITSAEIQADISMLPGGLYIVEFLGEKGGKFTSRIIKY